MIHSTWHPRDRPNERPRHAENALLIEAARAWCRARTRRLPTQPALFAYLHRFRCEQLVPVIDSLMLLDEQLRQRRFLAGCQGTPSGDEARLLVLFQQTGCKDAGNQAKGLERAFHFALRSIRIMMKLELGLARA